MRVRAAFAAAGVRCLTLSASAHHSHGQYDETFQDIEGVVKELHLLTPHSWVYIEVKDARARRSCGRSKPPLARSSNGSASRATRSSPATPSRRAVIRCGTRPTGASSGF